MDPVVWLAGSGGRTPFVGHFRGARTLGNARLAWAGRIAGTADVEQGWAAAEAARRGLAEADGFGGAAGALASACAALARIEPRWLARGDMSVLLVAREGDSAWAAGVGLGGIWAGTEAGGWTPAVPPDHPLLGEPGVPDGLLYALPPAPRWLAVTTGERFPAGDVLAACGVHA